MTNFDELTNRLGSNCSKWMVEENELPMWIADMDFKAADCIQKALEKRVAHGIFGYNEIGDQWADAYIGWWSRRHQFEMEKDWLIFCTGVVPAISSCVRKLSYPAEKVVVQTPVYNIFFNSIINNGRYIVESPLAYDGDKYSIDFDNLEKKLSDPQVSLMILCNPHNPVGKIWDKETLEKIGELCWKYSVVVIADEIHCDLTDPDKSYVPFASVSEYCRMNSVTCIAPTKAFSIAGLQTAAVCVPNPVLRHKVWRALNTDEVAEPNSFAIDVAVAAFNEGEQWNKELRDYIYSNKIYVREFVKENLPMCHLVENDAIYLLWLDCGKISHDSDELCEFIRKETGLFLNAGAHYGRSGADFVRINIATQKSRVMDGMQRLKKGIDLYMNLKSK